MYRIARACSEKDSLGRYGSFIPADSSVTREKGNDQKARRQDRRHHRRNGRDWVRHGETFRQRGCLCLHNGPSPEGTRRGREGNRHQRFWSSGRRRQLADLDRLYETVSKVKRRIDIIFANAGVGEFVAFGAVTEEHFDKLFNINVRGTLFTVQKALPLLNDGGSIILNGSVASIKGTAAFGVYAASKAAIRSFARTWTTDLKDRRIRSNVVSPGPIDTPLASRQSADVIARIVSTIPIGRMGKPDEVAKAALYLASDDSSFVTGIELFVDGGRAQV